MGNTKENEFNSQKYLKILGPFLLFTVILLLNLRFRIVDTYFLHRLFFLFVPILLVYLVLGIYAYSFYANATDQEIDKLLNRNSTVSLMKDVGNSVQILIVSVLFLLIGISIIENSERFPIGVLLLPIIGVSGIVYGAFTIVHYLMGEPILRIFSKTLDERKKNARDQRLQAHIQAKEERQRQAQIKRDHKNQLEQTRELVKQQYETKEVETDKSNIEYPTGQFISKDKQSQQYVKDLCRFCLVGDIKQEINHKGDKMYRCVICNYAHSIQRNLQYTSQYPSDQKQFLKQVFFNFFQIDPILNKRLSKIKWLGTAGVLFAIAVIGLIFFIFGFEDVTINLALTIYVIPIVVIFLSDQRLFRLMLKRNLLSKDEINRIRERAIQIRLSPGEKYGSGYIVYNVFAIILGIIGTFSFSFLVSLAAWKNGQNIIFFILAVVSYYLIYQLMGRKLKYRQSDLPLIDSRIFEIMQGSKLDVQVVK